VTLSLWLQLSRQRKEQVGWYGDENESEPLIQWTLSTTDCFLEVSDLDLSFLFMPESSLRHQILCRSLECSLHFHSSLFGSIVVSGAFGAHNVFLVKGGSS